MAKSKRTKKKDKQITEVQKNETLDIKEETTDYPEIKYTTKEEALEAVRRKGKNLEFCNEELQNDFDVVSTAVKGYAGSIQYASPEMRANYDIAKLVIERAPDALRYIRINDMDTKDAVEVVKGAVGRKPTALTFAGKYKDRTDIALYTIESLPINKTIDNIGSDLFLDITFIDGVGKIAQDYKYDDIMTYTLKQAFKESKRKPDYILDLRYGMAHFLYNGTIDEEAYNSLRAEFIDAQQGRDTIIKPFEIGEYTEADDHVWKNKVMEPKLKVEREMKDTVEEYKRNVINTYLQYASLGYSSEEATQKSTEVLLKYYFPEDKEFEEWFKEDSSNDIDCYYKTKAQLQEQGVLDKNGNLIPENDIESEEYRKRKEFAEKSRRFWEDEEALAEYCEASIQGDGEEIVSVTYGDKNKQNVQSQEEIYYDDDEMTEESEKALEKTLDEYEEAAMRLARERSMQQEMRSDNNYQEQEDDFPQIIYGEDDEIIESPFYSEQDAIDDYYSECARRREEEIWKDDKESIPSVTEWETNLDSEMPMEADLAWWDQFRDSKNGDIDLTKVNLRNVSFDRINALIRWKPEYIKELPEVPYPKGGMISKTACYGRNDERLFENIIKPYYEWTKQKNSIIAKIKELEEQNLNSDERNKEIADLKTKLVDLEEGKPSGMEENSLLIRYAGRAIRERNTHSKKDGGLECITKKFAEVNPKAFEYLAPRARADVNIANAVVIEDPSMLKFADVDTINDKNVVMKAYEKDPNCLRYAGKDFFQKNRSFVKKIIKERPEAVAEFAKGRLCNDREFAAYAVSQNGETLQFFSQNIQNDKTFIEAAIASSKGKSLNRADEKIINDPEWAKKATSIFPASLKFFKYAIKGMADVVKYAVTNDPNAIRYASEKIRGNKEMALSVVKEDGMALKNLSSDRKADYDVVLNAVRQNGEALKYASFGLKNDMEIVLAAVKQNGNAIQFATEEVKNDQMVALVALRQNIDSIGFIGKELANNNSFIDKATSIINETKRAETEKEGKEFIPYTKDEILNAIGKGRLPEDKSTFISRLGVGLTEVFVKPVSGVSPTAEKILKKVERKNSLNDKKTMIFDLDEAIKRGKEEAQKHKEERESKSVDKDKGKNPEVKSSRFNEIR